MYLQLARIQKDHWLFVSRRRLVDKLLKPLMKKGEKPWILVAVQTLT